MFRKIDWKSTLMNAVIGSILFLIPAFIFIRQADYTQSWLLFLGSGLFFFWTAIHTGRDSSKRGGNESTVALVFASHVTTVCAVIISTVVCFILLAMLVPGYLNAGPTTTELSNEPSNMVTDKTDGLSWTVFMASTIICFSGGSIAGITIPFYAKRNQTRDNKEPVPLQQNEVELQNSTSKR